MNEKSTQNKINPSELFVAKPINFKLFQLFIVFI